MLISYYYNNILSCFPFKYFLYLHPHYQQLHLLIIKTRDMKKIISSIAPIISALAIIDKHVRFANSKLTLWKSFEIVGNKIQHTANHLKNEVQ